MDAHADSQDLSPQERAWHSCRLSFQDARTRITELELATSRLVLDSHADARDLQVRVNATEERYRTAVHQHEMMLPHDSSRPCSLTPVREALDRAVLAADARLMELAADPAWRLVMLRRLLEGVASPGSTPASVRLAEQARSAAYQVALSSPEVVFTGSLPDHPWATAPFQVAPGLVIMPLPLAARLAGRGADSALLPASWSPRHTEALRALHAPGGMLLEELVGCVLALDS